MGKRKLPDCPNCARPVDHPDDGCVLGSLIQVIREREVMSESKLRKLHSATNADSLWTEVGKIVDQLESGEFQS